ncbi:MAG: acyl-CoA thioesterase [Bdellovibrionaceae bacterium]|nr:acyl-CoA thioesterase [Pseudobdellovibrionaceae bacterium]NUM57176.1 acyl-CoA thioesterase [Pseudobdellovibrionaceae bacterium]
MNYIYHHQISFDQCDPAGILFFANTWDICHRVYESWLLSLNPKWVFWFENQDWAIPIVNSEASFLRPIKPGTIMQVHLCLNKISDSSFTSVYEFIEEGASQRKTLTQCQITHVFVDKKTFKKIYVPSEVKTLFEPYLQKPLSS